MNGQFTNQFNISLMSLKHLLRFAKQLTIRFMNKIIIFKLIHWPFKFKGYYQNLYKYAVLLTKAWSKNLTRNQINIFLILIRLT